jgi:asparagine synthase (glutamine-hydrolysing)
MCGISGFNFADEKQAELMNQSIVHRGPDGTGIFTDESVTLGHVRLAVQDLTEAGQQPMLYKHGNKTAIVVLNGEIYNFQDIRRLLQDRGYAFRSRTDTEVLAASYLEWGFECVTRFNGMWAFVIYDPSEKLFFCCRDRLGVKPLCYYFDGNRFIFSSELKGILTHKYLRLNEKANIDRDAVNLYFSLGFVPSPHTVYKRTFKLEPRQSLAFDLRRKILKKWYYYSVPPYKPVNEYQKLVDEGRDILRDAVRLRLIADVPIGALLSGGLDSSTTVGFMKQLMDIRNLHTFSIGFQGRYDETPYIRLVSEYYGTKHHHYSFTERDFEELMDTYAWLYDEPLADYSGFPTYKLCKETRKHVKVALSGDGGDEIFGGYPEYVAGYRMDLLRRIPRLIRVILSKIPAKRNLNRYASVYLLKKAFRASLYDPALFLVKALEPDVITPDVCERWIVEKWKEGENDTGSMAESLRLFDLLFNTLPEKYLAKMDKAAMGNGLEARSPFLDYRLVEFSQKIPTKWKVDLFRTKILMRDIIKDIVPEEIVHRRKQGFVPPLQEWILNEKYEPFLAHSLELLHDLSPEFYFFFKEKALMENNRLYRLYRIRLFLFGKWIDRWVARDEGCLQK